MPTVYTARTTPLLSESLGDELVLYDTDANVAHALSGRAARVWRACAGGATADALVASTGLEQDVVTVALTELMSAELVCGDRVVSRRAVLAGAAAAGLASPLVLSVPIASATAAGSGPTVAGLAPKFGPIQGGTSVTIEGANFEVANTTVTIGGTTIPASSVVVDSSASLMFTTPAHAAGTVAVLVTTSAGTSADVPGGFTYENAPTAISLSPAFGPASGGTLVSITGTNFMAGDTSVTIDSTEIPSGSVTVNSSTSLTFTTPAHVAGTVAVLVTTSAGTSADVPGGFTYES